MNLLPFDYATRNLLRDPGRLLQTVGGTALVVLLIMGARAFNEGMQRSMQRSGSPDNIILLSAGSEENIQRSEVSENAAGIAETSIIGLHSIQGTEAVSPEIHHMAYLTFADGSRARGLIRGVTPKALMTHTGVTLTEGHFPGAGELLVGRMAWKQLGMSPSELKPGARVHFDERELTVSGVFAFPGSVVESEVWMDLNELRTLAQRESISAIVLRLGTAEAEDVDLFTKQRFDLELVSIPEQDYFAKLSAFYAPVRAMTWVTAGLIAVSAIFGGFNTLYAAFASRVREVATLQAIGFRPTAIILTFIQESLMTALIGTLVGALVANWLLPGTLVSISSGSFALSVEASTLYAGLIAGISLGLIGALPPALRCLRPPLAIALRDSA